MTARARIALLSLVLLALVACGGDDSGSTASTPTSAPSSSTSGAAATTTTAAAVPAGEAMVTGLELGTVTLTTPASGGGLHPLLAWEAVDGASYYSVRLYAPDGRPYWGWDGEATEIHVGGEPQLADRTDGPFVVDGMTWGVIGYDADWVPIAASDRRPIAP